MLLNRAMSNRLPVGRLFLLGMLFASMAQASAQVAPAAPKVSIEGSRLRVDYADGTSLSGMQLVGKEIVIGAAGEIRLRINAITPDASTPDVWLHDISARRADGQWQNVCQSDADGNRLALPVAGYTTANGSFVHDPAKLSITCSSGAQGKCLRFGYRYWMSGPDGQSLLPQFQACLRMVRADYCGDGKSWTENGTGIDVYDDVAIQFPEKKNPMPFEAGWSPDGAVCIHHQRIANKLAPAALRQQCPRLAAAPIGDQCSETWARAHGKAVLYNRSTP